MSFFEQFLVGTTKISSLERGRGGGGGLGGDWTMELDTMIYMLYPIFHSLSNLQLWTIYWIMFVILDIYFIFPFPESMLL